MPDLIWGIEQIKNLKPRVFLLTINTLSHYEISDQWYFFIHFNECRIEYLKS
jgi:hypothetical protein